jgi:hypothetical protein
MTEALHITTGPWVEAKGCEVHHWPTEGLARRLLVAMRVLHGRGGVNACVDCIERARASLPPRRV